MRNLLKIREVAAEAPLPGSRPSRGPTFCVEARLPMSHELIPFLHSAELDCSSNSRSVWVHYPPEMLRRPKVESEKRLDHVQEKPGFLAHPCMGGKSEVEEKKKKENAAFHDGHSLFQQLFFFCTVKNVGEVPGTGRIYVETVVDRDSGIAFAKVYSAKNAMNAVDILADRVVPFFQRQGIAIKEIHTRKTSEYCGLLPVHPFETFLTTRHIQHLPIDQSSQPYNYLCEQFYRLLLRDFFPVALRRKFQLSLDELQKDLDIFVQAYYGAQIKHENKMKSPPHPSANFPVDL
jgi:hypothetical protein